MKARPLAALLLGASILAAGPRVARAQSAADVAAARELFVQAAELAQKGSWNEARDRYERSLKLKRAAITLYSLGIAQKNTGRLVEALESLRAFLAEPSAAATKPYESPARDVIAELEPRVGRLQVSIAPAGAPDLAVTIDDQPVPAAALGVPRLVNPGRRVVAASARGHTMARKEVDVREGGNAAMEITLRPAPAGAPPGGPAPPLRASGSAGAAAGAAPLERREAEGPVDQPSRALPIALITGGAAVLVAGVVVGLVGVGAASDAPTRNGPEADAARTKTHVGDILGATGITAAGVGVVLLLTQRGGKATGVGGGRSSVAPALAIGPSTRAPAEHSIGRWPWLSVAWRR